MPGMPNLHRTAVVSLVVSLVVSALFLSGCGGETDLSSFNDPTGTLDKSVISDTQITPVAEATPVTPPVVQPDVLIDSPDFNKTVSSPLLIQGKVRKSYTYEGAFPLIIIDETGNTLGQSTGRVTSLDMTQDYVSFTAEIKFQPTGSTGTLVFKNDNPSGLVQNEKSISFPVIFPAAATAATPPVPVSNPPTEPQTTDTGNWKVFKSSIFDFQVSLPQEFVKEIGKDKNILVSFHYPKSTTEGTNLSDARIDVLKPKVDEKCFNSTEKSQPLTKSVTFNGVKFMEDRFSDGGAGQINEQVIYSTVRDTLCHKIILNMRSTNIGMYDLATAPKAFDYKQVGKTYSDIMGSLKFF